MPAYSGVAFSNNEFRWSPRIKRDDGLVRLVPGLGTRAVDRLGDDYPVLIAPGQPGLRANVSPDEIVRYSPQDDGRSSTSRRRRSSRSRYGSSCAPWAPRSRAGQIVSSWSTV